MAVLVWACFTLSVLQASQSYVLLTANMEDVHAIANQVAKSPLAAEVKEVWRRVSKTFKNHFDTPEEKSSAQMRADDKHLGRDDSSHETSRELMAERRQAKEELAALSRNVTSYIATIDNAIESL